MIQVSEVAKPPRKGRPIPAVRSPTRLCASPFYIRQFGSLRKLSDCYKSEAIPPPCDPQPPVSRFGNPRGNTVAPVVVPLSFPFSIPFAVPTSVPGCGSFFLKPPSKSWKPHCFSIRRTHQHWKNRLMLCSLQGQRASLSEMSGSLVVTGSHCFSNFQENSHRA